MHAEASQGRRCAEAAQRLVLKAAAVREWVGERLFPTVCFNEGLGGGTLPVRARAFEKSPPHLLPPPPYERSISPLLPFMLILSCAFVTARLLKGGSLI